MERFKPAKGRIMVLREDPIKVTPGGIQLPDTAMEKPVRGKVVAVGPAGDEVSEESRVFVVGDVVVFGSYGGTEVVVGDEKFLVIRDEEVIGVVFGSPTKK